MPWFDSLWHDDISPCFKNGFQSAGVIENDVENSVEQRDDENDSDKGDSKAEGQDAHTGDECKRRITAGISLVRIVMFRHVKVASRRCFRFVILRQILTVCKFMRARFRGGHRSNGLLPVISLRCNHRTIHGKVSSLKANVLHA